MTLASTGTWGGVYRMVLHPTFESWVLDDDQELEDPQYYPVPEDLQ